MPTGATARTRARASRKKKTATTIADVGDKGGEQVAGAGMAAPSVKAREAKAREASAKAEPRAREASAKAKPRAREASVRKKTREKRRDGSTNGHASSVDDALALSMRRTSSVERIRHLIVLDAQGVVHRLSAQIGAMIELFSRHRDRAPLLAPLRSWIPSASFDQLAELEPEEQRALSRFLEELEALRWYCRYTDDMPNTAQIRLTRFAGQLESAARKLIDTIQPMTRE